MIKLAVSNPSCTPVMTSGNSILKLWNGVFMRTTSPAKYSCTLWNADSWCVVGNPDITLLLDNFRLAGYFGLNWVFSTQVVLSVGKGKLADDASRLQGHHVSFRCDKHT